MSPWLSVLSFALLVVAGWTLLYGLVEFWTRWARRSSDRRALTSSRAAKPPSVHSKHGRFLLSSLSIDFSSVLARPGEIDQPSVSLVLRPGWLNLQASTWNDYLVSIFYASPPIHTHLQTDGSIRFKRQSRIKSLRRFYDYGSLAVLALLAALPPFLAHSVFILARGAVEKMPDSSVDGQSPTSAYSYNEGQPDESPLVLVPGLTTPLRDLPIVLAASFLAILWHELGHAMAAALEGIPLVGTGVILFVCFPGAYVSLPQASVELLPTWSKIRVVAAGIWHNLLMWGMILLVGWMGVGQILERPYGLIGFRYMNDYGVVVQTVNSDSPLASLLPPRTVITHLDDLELHDSATYNHWSNYLLHSNSEDASDKYSRLGWCVSEDDFEPLDQECCQSPTTGSNDSKDQIKGQSVCFVAANGNRGCLDPSPVLAYPRCIDTCSNSQLCIFPHASSNLLRLTVISTTTGRQQVIFYQGDKRQTFRAIEVDVWLAPSWLPQSLPHDVRRFWDYLATVSQSLAFFNLLTLPRLDGDELLTVLLSCLDRPPQFKHMIKQLANVLMGSLLSVFLVLAFWSSVSI